MPIEIRELVIRVSVNAPGAGGTAAPTSRVPATDEATEGAARQSLIADCVEQVLQVLRDQRER